MRREVNVLSQEGAWFGRGGYGKEMRRPVSHSMTVSATVAILFIGHGS